MSRKITGGRSVARINGETVPASKVKEAAALLIDIHGQHEHQSLLSKKKHLEILDDYAKTELQLPKETLKKITGHTGQSRRNWSRIPWMRSRDCGNSHFWSMSGRRSMRRI